MFRRAGSNHQSRGDNLSDHFPNRRISEMANNKKTLERGKSGRAAATTMRRNNPRDPTTNTKQRSRTFTNGSIRFTNETEESFKPQSQWNQQQHRRRRTQQQQEKVMVQSKNDKSPSRRAANSNLFRPSRFRSCALIPHHRISAERERKLPPPTITAATTTISYAKHMRTIESCTSPPRQRLSDNLRRNRGIVATHSVTPSRDTILSKPTASLQNRTTKDTRTDRIEESRNSVRSGTSHNEEATSSMLGEIRDAGNSDRDRLDRIEFTREHTDEATNSTTDCQSKVAVSGFQERTGFRDSLQRSKKSIQSNSVKTEGNEKIVSIRDHKTTPFPSSHCTIESLQPIKTPLGDKKMERSLQYNEDFHSLRLKYTECIQNLVAKTDASLSKTKKNDNCNEPMVVIRSRPLLDHETKKGSYSVVDIPLNSSRTLAMYETNKIMPPCDKKEKMPSVKAHVFQFDAVYSERDSFDEFYSQTVAPSVDIAKMGGVGTIVSYGSDEFGKSNTDSGIEKRLASSLFSKEGPLFLSSARSVFVTFLGFGRHSSDLCIDMLSHVDCDRHFVEVGIESNTRNGTCYKTYGATEIRVTSGPQLLDIFCNVQQKQRILGKESKDTSYSLCKIAIPTNNDEPPGLLYFVQCPAGDQVCSGYGRNSNNDSKEEEKNNSLASLMEFIQGNKKNKSTKKTHICNQPSCNLTRLLGQSILAAKKDETRLCLVASVSPCSDDSDATLSTMLSSREFMTKRRTHSVAKRGNSDRATFDDKKDNIASKTTAAMDQTAENADSLLLPRQWSPTRLWTWMQKKKLVADSNDASFCLEGQISGKVIMAMTKDQLRECFYRKKNNDANNGAAKKLFHALRAENDRIARLRVKRKFALQKSKK